MHLAKPKIQTKFIETLIVTIIKMRKYFIHALVAIRYNVIAKDVLLIVVAIIPKAAPTMVVLFIIMRFSSLIVAACRPKPRDTRYVLRETEMASATYTHGIQWSETISREAFADNLPKPQ